MPAPTCHPHRQEPTAKSTRRKTKVTDIDKKKRTALANQIAYRAVLDSIGFHSIKDEAIEVKKQSVYAREVNQKAFKWKMVEQRGMAGETE